MMLREFCRRLLFMCRKEMIATLMDKRMRIIMVVPPIMQGFLFGYAANYNLDQVPYVAVDESGSAESRDLLAHIDHNGAFVRVGTLMNPSGIDDAIDSESALLAVVIPQDFADQLARGEVAPLEVITDGRNTSVAGQAISYVNRVVMSWNAARTGEAGVSVVSRTWFNPNQITRWTFLPGLIGMISFVQIIMLAGLSIAKEREQGTFDQLLVTPMSPAEILIGKSLPPLCIGLVQSMLLFCICRYWFQVPFQGSLAALILTVIIFMLSSIGIGLSISAIARNMQQVLVYVFFMMLPIVLLSGISTPVANMPKMLQILTYANPMRFVLVAIRRIYLEGAGLGDIAMNYVPMLAVAAVTMPLAGWLFRHKTV